MTGTDLLAEVYEGRLHCAVVGKKGLSDLYADPLDMGGSWASLYLGKVAKIDRALDAALVDLGNGLMGYLPAKHVHKPGGDRSEQRTNIGEMLQPGQQLLVQIKSEGKRASPLEHAKMPRLTTQLLVLGHHLAYCPISNPVTMSRHIERADVLGMTAKLKAKGGWILQSHAGEAEVEVLRAEAEKLVEEWAVLEGAQKASEDKPRLLKAGPTALHRALFDHGAAAFDHIIMANRKLLEFAQAWCHRYDPPLATSKRLRLYKPDLPHHRIFDTDDIETALEGLHEDRVALACGGSLTIETTAALTILDVNQGSAQSPMAANRDAAVETARQIRLRNISGAVLVDFIGMEEKAQRAEISKTVETLFADDPGGGQVHGFTRLGILEISRKRRTASYAEKMKG
jgi:ribonuclease E/ribonuclease G